MTTRDGAFANDLEAKREPYGVGTSPPVRWLPRPVLLVGLLAVAMVTTSGTAVAQQPACAAERVTARSWSVEALGGATYCVTDGSNMSLFWVTARGVVALDAPPALMAAFQSAVAAVTAQRVTHVIYSHAHRDHIGAATRFESAHTWIAHTETNAILARRADPARPVANRIVTAARDTLRVGGVEIVLAYPGPGHLPGSLLIYEPASRVLAGIDLYNGGNAPFFRFGMTTDIPSYVAVHDSLLAFDFRYFVGGHGARAGTRTDLERQRQYVRDVVTYADSALATVRLTDVVAALAQNHHPFERTAALFAAQTRECERRTLAVWRGRLPGVEHSTHANCDAALESRRVD